MIYKLLGCAYIRHQMLETREDKNTVNVLISTPYQGDILQSRSVFYTYLWQFYSKYILKVPFIYKHNHTVWCTLFVRSKMVQNVDFRDIQAHEPLPKFWFWNVFVTSKTWNFWLSLRCPSCTYIKSMIFQLVTQFLKG